MQKIVDVVIPAFNEEGSIGLVVRDIPKNLVRNVIVVNNNSTDGTARAAEAQGAILVSESEQGYGAACLRGLEYIRNLEVKPDIVVFVDADHSDYPEEMDLLVAPIVNEGMDLVIGSRSTGVREKGAMMPQQVFGNWLATRMMKILFKASFTDLGPFRAITWKALEKIEMKDRNFGWTVEMQVKILKHKMNYTEVPVRYRKRIGVSKITGTVKGTVMAGYKIISTILKYA